MISQVSLFFIIFAAIAIQAKELDRGPQTFPNTNSLTEEEAQKQQKKFVTNDFIVYLTPKQIEDLQAGTMELRSHSSGEITMSRSQNVRNNSPRNSQSAFDYHRENLNILKTPLVQEEQLQTKEQKQQKERYFNVPNGAPINNAEVNQENRRPEVPKLNSNDQNQENNTNEWTTRKPTTEEILKQQSLQEQFKNYLQNSFKNIDEQYRQPENGNPEAEKQQQVPIYSPFIHALVQEHLREQSNEIEKQKALAQENTLANLSPIIIHKEVQITKHTAVPVVKHVNVPTPVFVPFLHPYEVKVPQPYPVPINVIKHIHAQPRKTEKAEAEKAEAEKAEAEKVPNELRKHNLDKNPVPVNVMRPEWATSTQLRRTEKTEKVPNALRNNNLGKNVYINVDSPSYLHVWKN